MIALLFFILVALTVIAVIFSVVFWIRDRKDDRD
jgi:drug/metabolite transporter superfamily protein YnfA